MKKKVPQTNQVKLNLKYKKKIFPDQNRNQHIVRLLCTNEIRLFCFDITREKILKITKYANKKINFKKKFFSFFTQLFQFLISYTYIYIYIYI